MGKFLRASAFTDLARFMADYTHWLRTIGSPRAGERSRKADRMKRH
jgi:hypothetical protein